MVSDVGGILQTWLGHLGPGYGSHIKSSEGYIFVVVGEMDVGGVA